MKKYKFSKKDGCSIDRAKTLEWIDKYKKKHPDGIHAYFFGEDIIRRVIDQPEAVGMRIYLAYGDEGKLQMVLLGAREDGTNIMPEGDGKDGGRGGTSGDGGLPCPPYC